MLAPLCMFETPAERKEEKETVGKIPEPQSQPTSMQSEEESSDDERRFMYDEKQETRERDLYSFRERPKVDYNPPPQLRRPPKANMLLIERIDQELPSLLIYRSKCEPENECDVPDAINIVPTDPSTKPISIAPPEKSQRGTYLSVVGGLSCC